MDELIGKLLTYEIKKNQEKKIGCKRKEENLVLKATERDNVKKKNTALMTKRFQRVLKKKGQSSQKRNYQRNLGKDIMD